MFDLTSALTADVKARKAKGTTPGVRQLREAQRAEFAALTADQLRAAHRGTIVKGVEQMTIDLKRATMDGNEAEVVRLESAIDTATNSQSAYWDELVWSSDLGGSGHFIRSIYSKALNLDLIGHKPEDTLQDALEVALHNLSERPAGAVDGRYSRQLRVRKVTAQLRTARMTDTVLPITRGELFRCVRYVYKRGLNQFAYTMRGQMTVTDGTKLTPRKAMSVSLEESAARADKRRQCREADAALARVEKLRAQGWTVEAHVFNPERVDKLDALVAEYPLSAAQLPLRLAQALVAGYSVAQFLVEVRHATGKTYSEQTLMRWASQLAAL